MENYSFIDSCIVRIPQFVVITSGITEQVRLGMVTIPPRSKEQRGNHPRRKNDYMAEIPLELRPGKKINIRLL